MQHARNFLMIERLRQNRQMRWDDRNVQSGTAFFYEQLVSAWFGWQKKNSVRRIRRVFEAFVAAINADESLDFVIVRREIFIAVRPVNSEAITTAWFEIVWSHPECNAAPMIGAPAQHSRAPP